MTLPPESTRVKIVAGVHTTNNAFECCSFAGTHDKIQPNDPPTLVAQNTTDIPQCVRPCPPPTRCPPTKRERLYRPTTGTNHTPPHARRCSRRHRARGCSVCEPSASLLPTKRRDAGFHWGDEHGLMIKTSIAHSFQREAFFQHASQSSRRRCRCRCRRRRVLLLL
jgi:hypothetical protein